MEDDIFTRQRAIVLRVSFRKKRIQEKAKLSPFWLFCPDVQTASNLQSPNAGSLKPKPMFTIHTASLTGNVSDSTFWFLASNIVPVKRLLMPRYAILPCITEVMHGNIKYIL